VIPFVDAASSSLALRPPHGSAPPLCDAAPPPADARWQGRRVTRFPEQPEDKSAVIIMEDTDKPLPERVSQSTRYAYFKTIAKGGKSIIQTCKDMHLARTIVYKKLRPEFAADATEQRRFLREARVTAMLQHPNTVPCYEVGRDTKGAYYFTMKLVHGYTLREVLDYREKYDLSQLIEVVVQVAHALEYAHTHRVVHRDIKPENVLVGPFGEVLVLDWGLAKVWKQDGSAEDLPQTSGAPEESDLSMTGHGHLQGTISYMSPEQIHKDPQIDYRTDIFSLGVVLYEILAGRPPVVGESVQKIRDEILSGVVPRPSSLTESRVPRLLEDAAMQCIAKDPDARLQDCGQLTRILQEDWPASETRGNRR